MFCPKCGGSNPETGKFCRSCGTDLKPVSAALSGQAPQPLKDRRGRPISWQSAIPKLTMGVAFAMISFILGWTGMIGAKTWWFWLLIPAFAMIGTGIAQIIQIRQSGSGAAIGYSGTPELTGTNAAGLPPPQTESAAPESHYRTGDLVPPSVTDNTTRHLELDSEGKTMTLPKK